MGDTESPGLSASSYFELHIWPVMQAKVARFMEAGSSILAHSDSLYFELTECSPGSMH